MNEKILTEERMFNFIQEVLGRGMQQRTEPISYELYEKAKEMLECGFIKSVSPLSPATVHYYWYLYQASKKKEQDE